jgi:hypothetical protein
MAAILSVVGRSRRAVWCDGPANGSHFAGFRCDEEYQKEAIDYSI